MVRLLPNRISATLSEAQKRQFIAGIKMSMDALPSKPAISDVEYDKLYKKGAAREKEATQMIRIVRRFPRFLPTHLSLAEVEKDAEFYQQLKNLSEDQLALLQNLVAFFMGVVGAEELNAYSIFEENVKIAAAQNDPEAIEALNQINSIDRNRNNGKTKSAK
jgi:hypothetical protein